MKSGQKSFVIGVACLAIALGIIAWSYVSRRTAHVGVSNARQTETSLTPEQAVSANNEAVRAELKAAPRDPASVAQEPQEAGDRPPEIDPSDNPGVASIAEALQTGQHAERLTPMLSPKPFDKTAYDANPEGWARIVEPGRVWLVAEGAPGVKALEPKGVASLEVLSGGSVPLTVIGEPHGPCSFTSLDGGAFDNKAGSITVIADEKGEATANFTATSGTRGAVNIMAACPLNSGQVTFRVEVK